MRASKQSFFSLFTAIAVLSVTMHCSCMAAAGITHAVPACCQKRAHSDGPNHSSVPCPHCSGGMVMDHVDASAPAAMAVDVTFFALPSFEPVGSERILTPPQYPRSQSPPLARASTLLTLHSLLTV